MSVASLPRTGSAAPEGRPRDPERPPPVLHIAWAQLLLRSLWHAGVRDVVVSPGSRSTPLALAAHESADLRSHFIVDERTAAFFALGQARVTGRPSALVCTSGTAAAHYFPALIEASMSGVPMIAITADRPWELQQSGAAQTIDQQRLFGAFTRHFASLGAPEPTEAALRAVARTAAHAVARALGPEPGPVHINAPFRKPLEPASAPTGTHAATGTHASTGTHAPTGTHAATGTHAPAPWHAAWTALMRSGPTRSIDPARAVDPASLDEVARLVAAARRGLIACGPAPAHGDLDALRREVASLAAATGFPVLAEAPSQLRFGLAPGSPESPAPAVISSFDALLRSRSFRARLAPDLIVELGAPPTSTGYSLLLADHPDTPRVVVSPVGWTDPASTAVVLVHADTPPFCEALRARLATTLSFTEPPRFAAAFAEADARARAVTAAAVPEAPTAPLTEAAAARAIVAACPADSILVLGNSSPVRDVDTFCFASPKPLRVLHQRGASGIDGLVSGAAGAQSVSGTPVTLLLGDLSFLHDLGGLALARAAAGPLVIVVVNNGGGRIFEQLPIGRVLGPGDAFERCFATPEPVDLAAAAAAFDIPFARAATPESLAESLARARSHAGATLVEALVPPHDGAERNKAVWTRVDEAEIAAATRSKPPVSEHR